MSTNAGGRELAEQTSRTPNVPTTEAVASTERADQQVTPVSTPAVGEQLPIVSPPASSSDQIHAPAATNAPPQVITSSPAHSSDVLYEYRDDSRRPTVPPISTSDQISPYSSTPQVVTPIPVDRSQLQPHGSRLVESVERDPREQGTILREPIRSSPSPSRTRPPTSESTTGIATPTQARLAPDPTRPSPGRQYTQPRASSVVFHEDLTTSDMEHDQDADPRRVYTRKNQPLPPLPGRMASMNTAVTSQVQEVDLSSPTQNHSYSAQQLVRRPQSAESTGTGGVDRGHGYMVAASRSNVVIAPPGGVHGPSTVGHGSEAVLGLTRNDTRPTLGTSASQPTLDRSRTLRSGVDWVGLDDKTREKTLGERLDPTLETARLERDKFASKAKMTGYSLNIAIGLQVVLGAMTTGLSVVTTGKQTSIMTAILGGFATIVASFLARARGSREPELSVTRFKDLEQFIRECEAFKLDHGHLRGSGYPDQGGRLQELRDRFEILLGNSGNGPTANLETTGKGV